MNLLKESLTLSAVILIIRIGLKRKTVRSLPSLYLEYYNQFKVHLPCTAVTFNLLLKIDSRSQIKTSICSQMVQALSPSWILSFAIYMKCLKGLEGEFLHSLEG